MSPDSFTVLFNRVVGIEGGYTNDPTDPGGETKWGISKRAYPNLDIPSLTRENALSIYFQDFWLRLAADNLPTSVNYQLLDFAINSGMDTSIRYFQRCLGVADDGFFGPVSKEAAAHMPECTMIMKLNAERLEFMTKLKNWPNAGKGWANRIAQNLRYGAMDI